MTNSAQISPKKKLFKLGIPASLVAGIAVGAMFSPVGIASAEEVPQVSDETAQDTTADKPSDGQRKARKAQREQHKAEHQTTHAELLGISVDELTEARQQGKSLAEVAKENGIERDDLVAALTAVSHEHIDQAVADGKIDEDKAEKAKERTSERIERRIDQSKGDSEGRQGKHRGPRGKHRGNAVAR